MAECIMWVVSVLGLVVMFAGLFVTQDINAWLVIGGGTVAMAAPVVLNRLT